MKVAPRIAKSGRFSRVVVIISEFISFINKLDVFLKVSEAFDNYKFSGHLTKLCRDGTGIFTNTFTLSVDEELVIFPVLVVVIPSLIEHNFWIFYIALSNVNSSVF